MKSLLVDRQLDKKNLPTETTNIDTHCIQCVLILVYTFFLSLLSVKKCNEKLLCVWYSRLTYCEIII